MHFSDEQALPQQAPSPDDQNKFWAQANPDSFWFWTFIVVSGLYLTGAFGRAFGPRRGGR